MTAIEKRGGSIRTSKGWVHCGALQLEAPLDAAGRKRSESKVLAPRRGSMEDVFKVTGMSLGADVQELAMALQQAALVAAVKGTLGKKGLKATPSKLKKKKAMSGGDSGSARRFGDNISNSPRGAASGSPARPSAAQAATALAMSDEAEKAKRLEQMGFRSGRMLSVEVEPETVAKAVGKLELKAEAEEKEEDEEEEEEEVEESPLEGEAMPRKGESTPQPAAASTAQHDWAAGRGGQLSWAADCPQTIYTAKELQQQPPLAAPQHSTPEQQQRAEEQQPPTPNSGEWASLTASVRKAAITVGFSPSGNMWDEDRYPETSSKPWGALSAEQHTAAKVLGYEQKSWDAELPLTTPAPRTRAELIALTAGGGSGFCDRNNDPRAPEASPAVTPKSGRSHSHSISRAISTPRGTPKDVKPLSSRVVGGTQGRWERVQCNKSVHYFLDTTTGEALWELPQEFRFADDDQSGQEGDDGDDDYAMMPQALSGGLLADDDEIVAISTEGAETSTPESALPLHSLQIPGAHFVSSDNVSTPLAQFSSEMTPLKTPAAFSCAGAAPPMTPSAVTVDAVSPVAELALVLAPRDVESEERPPRRQQQQQPESGKLEPATLNGSREWADTDPFMFMGEGSPGRDPWASQSTVDDAASKLDRSRSGSVSSAYSLDGSFSRDSFVDPFSSALNTPGKDPWATPTSKEGGAGAGAGAVSRRAARSMTVVGDFAGLAEKPEEEAAEEQEEEEEEEAVFEQLVELELSSLDESVGGDSNASMISMDSISESEMIMHAGPPPPSTAAPHNTPMQQLQGSPRDRMLASSQRQLVEQVTAALQEELSLEEDAPSPPALGSLKIRQRRGRGFDYAEDEAPPSPVRFLSTGTPPPPPSCTPPPLLEFARSPMLWTDNLAQANIARAEFIECTTSTLNPDEVPPSPPPLPSLLAPQAQRSRPTLQDLPVSPRNRARQPLAQLSQGQAQGQGQGRSDPKTRKAERQRQGLCVVAPPAPPPPSSSSSQQQQQKSVRSKSSVHSRAAAMLSGGMCNASMLGRLQQSRARTSGFKNYGRSDEAESRSRQAALWAKKRAAAGKLSALSEPELESLRTGISAVRSRGRVGVLSQALGGYYGASGGVTARGPPPRMSPDHALSAPSSRESSPRNSQKLTAAGAVASAFTPAMQPRAILASPAVVTPVPLPTPRGGVAISSASSSAAGELGDVELQDPSRFGLANVAVLDEFAFVEATEGSWVGDAGPLRLETPFSNVSPSTGQPAFFDATSLDTLTAKGERRPWAELNAAKLARRAAQTAAGLTAAVASTTRASSAAWKDVAVPLPPPSDVLEMHWLDNEAGGKAMLSIGEALASWFGGGF